MKGRSFSGNVVELHNADRPYPPRGRMPEKSADVIVLPVMRMVGKYECPLDALGLRKE